MKSQIFSKSDFIGFESYFHIDPRLILCLDKLSKLFKSKNYKIHFKSPSDDLSKKINIKSEYYGRYFIIEFSDFKMAYEVITEISDLLNDDNNDAKYYFNHVDIYNLSFCYYYNYDKYLYVSTLDYSESNDSGLKVTNNFILY